MMKSNNVFLYTFYGFLFGVLFPVLSYPLLDNPNILFGVIASAPFVIASVVFIIATKVEKNFNRLTSKTDEYGKILNDFALILEIDEGRKITFLNDASKKIFKYDNNDEVLGKSLEFLTGNEYQESFWDRVFLDMVDKDIWQGEISLKDRFGDTIWVDLTMVSAYLDNKKHFRIIGIDITSMKNQDISYEILFNQSVDAIMTLSPPDWRFTSCNHSTLDLFKVSSENEFRLLGPWDVSPEFQEKGIKSSDLAKEKITQAMEKGAAYFDWTHKNLNGENIPCKVLLSRISNKNSNYLLANVRDVSDIKKKEDELSFQNQKLKLLAEMALQIGHEINTPLNVILMIASTLKFKMDHEKDLNPDLISDVTDMVKTIKTISEIVQSLKIIGRADAEYSENINIVDYVESYTRIISKIYQQEKVNVFFNCNPSLSFFVKGNLGNFHQIISNFVSNAKDALVESEKEEEKKISISIERRKNILCIIVEDNADGIPQDRLEKIFLNEYTTKFMGRGLGMGLAIAKKLVEEFKGSIEVYSEVGQGTRFEICFPETDILSDPKRDITSERKPLKGKVLVCEDNDLMRELLTITLKNFGVEVTESVNGVDALLKLEQEKFDVLITDLRMDEMDGEELIRKIQSLEIPEMKIIVLTGELTPFLNSENKKFLKDHSDSLLSKPVSPEKLYTILTDYMLS